MILWMVDPYDSSLCKCCMSCNISSLKSKFEMSARFVVMFLPSKVSGYCQHVFELEVAISISSQNSRTDSTRRGYISILCLGLANLLIGQAKQNREH